VSWHAALHILILIYGYIISAASYPAVFPQPALDSGKGTQNDPIASPRKGCREKDSDMNERFPKRSALLDGD
jgi:hypothetical protein